MSDVYEFEKPSAWRYIFLGLLIGWLGSFVIIKFILPDLIRFLLVGVFMGLAVGISNASIIKTVFSLLGGLIAGIFVFTYYAHLAHQEFLYQLPPLLFWYGTAIILCLIVVNRKEKDMLIHAVQSFFASLIVAVIVYALSWLSVGITLGIGLAGSKSADIPQIVVGTIAITLFNLSINIGTYQWKQP